jgi:uncharacterized protein YeaO (DUF488 family)
MPIKLFEYSWGERRIKKEGVRLSCTRYLPRGIRRSDYARLGYFDVWMPVLAPSRKLMSWAKRRDLNDPKIWKVFAMRYRKEMSRTAPRQMIRALALLANKTPISIGCSCKEFPCHRFELADLVHSAAKK